VAELEDYLNRQAGILENARARLLVTTPEMIPVARMLCGTLGSGLTMTTTEEFRQEGGPSPGTPGRPGDPALIQ
jgi:hypothetical protein